MLHVLIKRGSFILHFTLALGFMYAYTEFVSNNDRLLQLY